MPKFNMNWLYIFVIIALGVVFFAGGNGIFPSSAGVDKDYTTFKQYVAKGYGTKALSIGTTTPYACMLAQTTSVTSSRRALKK